MNKKHDLRNRNSWWQEFCDGYEIQQKTDIHPDIKLNLLKRARTFCNRPVRLGKRPSDGKLDNALCVYTTSGFGCDLDFSEQIIKMRPNWFLGVSDDVKKQLTEIIDKGGPRPRGTSKLVLPLLHCIRCHNVSDYEFTKRIKTAAPWWPHGGFQVG